MSALPKAKPPSHLETEYSESACKRIRLDNDRDETFVCANITNAKGDACSAENTERSLVPYTGIHQTTYENIAFPIVECDSIEHFSITLDFRPSLFHPRGLLNENNWCYLNAILQSLLKAHPFFNLLKDLGNRGQLFIDALKDSAPILTSMVIFSRNFHAVVDKEEGIIVDSDVFAIRPVSIHRVLRQGNSVWGTGDQQDAQEFLETVIDGMHEEFKTMLKSPRHLVNYGKDREERTPISDIFQGEFLRCFTCGTKTTVSTEPFFSLILNIQEDGIDTIEDALKDLTKVQSVEGYACEDTKEPLEAFQRTTLKTLPPILIVSLNRVRFAENSLQKSLKVLRFPLELEIGPQYRSPGEGEGVLYSLYGVVYHTGRNTRFGHYTVALYVEMYQRWYFFDDDCISPFREELLFKVTRTTVPYLLLYRQGSST